jgi:type II secretory pathway pseudopilin PulG
MFKNPDRGDSLLEVVISTVIMGIIGVLLVSSVAVARPFADKMSLVGQTVQNLNSLAESINLQPFTPCTPQNSEPYAFAQALGGAQNSSTAFRIATDVLPPVMVSTSTERHLYSAKLMATGASSPVTWQVEPLLPMGLSLDPSTGVISGETTQPITANYDFTATSGSAKDIKSLTLTAALVTILNNDGNSWVPCETLPLSLVTGAVGDGVNATYYYTGAPISKGAIVSVWGTGNSQFDAKTLQVLDATNDSFTAANQSTGSVSSGYAGLSSELSVQQVVVSTVVAGSPFHKVITKVAS